MHASQRITLPPEIRHIAQLTRDTFGPSVKLTFWADNNGNTQGKRENDDPGATLRSTEWETR